MQRVATRLLRPGLVLARPVTDGGGNSVFPKNMEVSDRMVDTLERMRIRSVVVKGIPYPPNLPLVDLKARLSGLESAFDRVKGDALMEKLRVIVKAHFIRRDAEIRGTQDDE
ncbi:hypothetical protein JW916_03545 [Candidatus Sumerlaeota bacterium]|nr:hypothetical protein [Candidatus Sumerlaeota bacterium]